MSAKYVINQIHRFNFLAVNDFRVYLRGLYVGVAEQFARGIRSAPRVSIIVANVWRLV